jgi:NhaP-type Na+/H+ and K+/H+ antiporter
MNQENIVLVIKDIENVLVSQSSTLSEDDKKKLIQAKTTLENDLQEIFKREITWDDKIKFAETFCVIIEIIKTVSDHFK